MLGRRLGNLPSRARQRVGFSNDYNDFYGNAYLCLHLNAYMYIHVLTASVTRSSMYRNHVPLGLASCNESAASCSAMSVVPRRGPPH